VVEQTLSNWVKAHREGELKEVPGKAGVTAEQMEISRLRAELPQLRFNRRSNTDARSAAASLLIVERIADDELYLLQPLE
jgi:transposase-like protein